MKNLLSKAPLGLLSASLLVCALVFLVYLYAARPMADDFGWATTASLTEAFARTVHYYLNWGGRWASIGIENIGWCLIPQRAVNIGHYYSLFLGIVLLGSFGGLFAIMKCLLLGSASSILLRTSIVALFYFSFYHSPADTLFWVPGATEGGLAAVLMSLSIWLVVRGLASNPVCGLWTYILVGLCILFGSGCHELAGMTASAFFCVLFLWCFLCNGRRVPALVVFSLAISLTATAISVLAPGNSVRSALEFSNHFSIPNTLRSLSWLLRRTIVVILSPQILLGIPAALIFLRKSDSVRGNLLSHRKLLQAVGVSMAFAVLAVMLVYALKAANNPAGRTVNFFSSSLMLVAVPAMMIVWLGRREPGFSALPDGLQPWLLTLLAISIFTGPTLDRGLFSYKTDLIPWIRYQEKKHRQLLQAAKSGEFEVVMDASPPPPPLIFTEAELNMDVDFWGNRKQADYYGVHSIRIREGTDSSPRPRK